MAHPLTIGDHSHPEHYTTCQTCSRLPEEKALVFRCQVADARDPLHNDLTIENQRMVNVCKRIIELNTSMVETHPEEPLYLSDPRIEDGAIWLLIDRVREPIVYEIIENKVLRPMGMKMNGFRYIQDVDLRTDVLKERVQQKRSRISRACEHKPLESLLEAQNSRVREAFIANAKAREALERTVEEELPILMRERLREELGLAKAGERASS